MNAFKFMPVKNFNLIAWSDRQNTVGGLRKSLICLARLVKG